MIVDTSAVIAVIEREPGYERVLSAIERSKISAATLVELTAVLSRYGQIDQVRRVERLLRYWEIDVVAFDEEQARVAQQAYRDYGRGSGHPARLNLGDCYGYALAAVQDEPLLFVGDGFGHTDIRPAL